MENYTLLAIPMFIVLMAIEIGFDLVTKMGRYRFKETISSLGAGLLHQSVDVFKKTGVLVLFGYLSQTYGIFKIEASILSFIVLFILVDFIAYWVHRWSHELNFLWAMHEVHHSSEDYNLATALRQSLLNDLVLWALVMPLAFLGFSAEMLLATYAFVLIYQFFIHTQSVGKLGVLEYVLNTPSHHRVHHGRNPQYIDKNHGNVLIIWDRLFGTFEPEVEKVDYGITTPLLTANPIWVNMHYWVRMYKQLPLLKSFKAKLKFIFAQGPKDQPDATYGLQPVASGQPGSKLRRAYELSQAVGYATLVIGFVLLTPFLPVEMILLSLGLLLLHAGLLGIFIQKQHIMAEATRHFTGLLFFGLTLWLGAGLVGANQFLSFGFQLGLGLTIFSMVFFSAWFALYRSAQPGSLNHAHGSRT